MTSVFVVQHEYEQWDREHVFFIGVYKTKAAAQAAIETLKEQPGFRNWPDGFSIEAYPLGKTHWTEGFVTLVPVLVGLKGGPEPRWKTMVATWSPGDVFSLEREEEDEEDWDLWAFRPGQKVLCEERTIEGVPNCLVAIAEAGGDG